MSATPKYCEESAKSGHRRGNLHRTHMIKSPRSTRRTPSELRANNLIAERRTEDLSRRCRKTDSGEQAGHQRVQPHTAAGRKGKFHHARRTWHVTQQANPQVSTQEKGRHAEYRCLQRLPSQPWKPGDSPHGRQQVIKQLRFNKTLSAITKEITTNICHERGKWTKPDTERVCRAPPPLGRPRKAQLQQQSVCSQARDAEKPSQEGKLVPLDPSGGCRIQTFLKTHQTIQ